MDLLGYSTELSKKLSFKIENGKNEFRAKKKKWRYPVCALDPSINSYNIMIKSCGLPRAVFSQIDGYFLIKFPRELVTRSNGSSRRRRCIHIFLYKVI